MEAAQATLKKSLEKILDDLEYSERDVQIIPVSSGGANYTSVIFEVTVTCPSKPTLDLFAKVAILNEALRKQIDDDPSKSFYYQEFRVYDELAKLYNELESKHSIPLEHRYIFPKLYGCNLTVGEETFVMENLTKQNFHVFSRFNPLDWEHAAVSVRDLAKFHALSMALEKQCPEAFEMFTATYTPGLDAFENMIKSKLFENIHLTPEEFKGRVQNFLENNTDICKLWSTPFGKQVLIHGDYRSSNILYKRQAGNLISVPVDYQTVHLGNPFIDFFHFVSTGSDETFRKLYYDQLVEYFYTEMGHALKRLGLDISQEYPRHVFDEDHKLFLPMLLVSALTFLPIIVIPEDEAPDMTKEDSDLFSFVAKPNEIYQERLNGYVRDAARWGII